MSVVGEPGANYGRKLEPHAIRLKYGRQESMMEQGHTTYSLKQSAYSSV